MTEPWGRTNAVVSLKRKVQHNTTVPSRLRVPKTIGDIVMVDDGIKNRNYFKGKVTKEDPKIIMRALFSNYSAPILMMVGYCTQ
jgi:hypothetical protein